MKYLTALVLAMFALVDLSKADQVLIYKGSEVDRSYGTGKTQSLVADYYWLFDLTTLNFDYVYYFKSSGKKLYATYAAVAFVSEQVQETAKTTNTNFVYSKTATPSVLDLGFAGGVNSSIAVSSTSTAEYPRTLAFQSHYFYNNGAASTNTVTYDSGMYHLDLPLTQESNNAGDSLTGANTVVTNFLQQQGYTPAP